MAHVNHMLFMAHVNHMLFMARPNIRPGSKFAEQTPIGMTQWKITVCGFGFVQWLRREWRALRYCESEGRLKLWQERLSNVWIEQGSCTNERERTTASWWCHAAECRACGNASKCRKRLLPTRATGEGLTEGSVTYHSHSPFWAVTSWSDLIRGPYGPCKTFGRETVGTQPGLGR